MNQVASQTNYKSLKNTLKMYDEGNRAMQKVRDLTAWPPWPRLGHGVVVVVGAGVVVVGVGVVEVVLVCGSGASRGTGRRARRHAVGASPTDSCGVLSSGSSPCVLTRVDDVAVVVVTAQVGAIGAAVDSAVDELSKQHAVRLRLAEQDYGIEFAESPWSLLLEEQHREVRHHAFASAVLVAFMVAVFMNVHHDRPV